MKIYSQAKKPQTKLEFATLSELREHLENNRHHNHMITFTRNGEELRVWFELPAGVIENPHFEACGAEFVAVDGDREERRQSLQFLISGSRKYRKFCDHYDDKIFLPYY